MAIFLYKDITNTRGTAENFSTGELYNASFDLRKFDKKSLSKDHYVVTSLNHRLKVVTRFLFMTDSHTMECDYIKAIFTVMLCVLKFTKLVNFGFFTFCLATLSRPILFTFVSC